MRITKKMLNSMKIHSIFTSEGEGINPRLLAWLETRGLDPLSIEIEGNSISIDSYAPGEGVKPLSLAAQMWFAKGLKQA